MLKNLLALLMQPGVMGKSVHLAKTIQSVTADRKLTREEQSLLLKEFWALVRAIRGSIDDEEITKEKKTPVSPI